MKRLTALILTLAVAGGCLIGCGSSGGNTEGTKNNKTTDIEIGVYNTGIGTEWLDAVIEGFEDVHPEYHVFYTASANAKSVLASFGMSDIDTKDLYFCYWQTDPTYLEPLDDVYDATVEGEAIPIKEKFKKMYLNQQVAQDGHYYMMPTGGGVMGFVYNTKLFEDAGITQLPRTTDELIVTCDKLYSKGITPLCHFAGGGYYSYLHHEFMSHYDGLDYIVNTFYACTDENGTSPSKEVFAAKDGRYYALKAFEKMITPEYTLTGSNSKSHTEIQTEFLSGKAAMMYNGSWMLNEMNGMDAGDSFKYMKTPVLSAITDKLTTVKSDAQLRKVITAVDEVTNGTKQESEYLSGEEYNIDGMKISKADWDIISNARNTVGNNFVGEGAFIPNYSNAKEGAKEFLKYVFSDKGYEAYVKATSCPRPMTLSTGEMPDTSELNAFAQAQFKMIQTSENFVSQYVYSEHEIFKTGGASYLAEVTFVNKFSTSNPKDRKTADEIWATYLQKVDDSYETSWLKNMK